MGRKRKIPNNLEVTDPVPFALWPIPFDEQQVMKLVHDHSTSELRQLAWQRGIDTPMHKWYLAICLATNAHVFIPAEATHYTIDTLREMVKAFSLAAPDDISKFDKLQLQSMMMDFWQQQHGSQERDRTLHDELAREQATLSKMWSMENHVENLKNKLCSKAVKEKLQQESYNITAQMQVLKQSMLSKYELWSNQLNQSAISRSEPDLYKARWRFFRYKSQWQQLMDMLLQVVTDTCSVSRKAICDMDEMPDELKQWYRQTQSRSELKSVFCTPPIMTGTGTGTSEMIWKKGSRITLNVSNGKEGEFRVDHVILSKQKDFYWIGVTCLNGCEESIKEEEKQSQKDKKKEKAKKEKTKQEEESEKEKDKLQDQLAVSVKDAIPVMEMVQQFQAHQQMITQPVPNPTVIQTSADIPIPADVPVDTLVNFPILSAPVVAAGPPMTIPNDQAVVPDVVPDVSQPVQQVYSVNPGTVQPQNVSSSSPPQDVSRDVFSTLKDHLGFVAGSMASEAKNNLWRSFATAGSGLAMPSMFSNMFLQPPTMFSRTHQGQEQPEPQPQPDVKVILPDDQTKNDQKYGQNPNSQLKWAKNRAGDALHSALAAEFQRNQQPGQPQSTWQDEPAVSRVETPGNAAPSIYRPEDFKALGWQFHPMHRASQQYVATAHGTTPWKYVPTSRTMGSRDASMLSRFYEQAYTFHQSLLSSWSLPSPISPSYFIHLWKPDVLNMEQFRLSAYQWVHHGKWASSLLNPQQMVRDLSQVFRQWTGHLKRWDPAMLSNADRVIMTRLVHEYSQKVSATKPLSDSEIGICLARNMLLSHESAHQMHVVDFLQCIRDPQSGFMHLVFTAALQSFRVVYLPDVNQYALVYVMPGTSSTSSTNKYISGKHWVYHPSMVEQLAPWHTRQSIRTSAEAKKIGQQTTWFGVYQPGQPLQVTAIRGTEMLWTPEKVWDLLPPIEQTRLFEQNYRTYHALFSQLIPSVKLPSLPTSHEMMRSGWRNFLKMEHVQFPPHKVENMLRTPMAIDPHDHALYLLHQLDPTNPLLLLMNRYSINTKHGVRSIAPQGALWMLKDLQAAYETECGTTANSIMCIMSSAFQEQPGVPRQPTVDVIDESAADLSHVPNVEQMILSLRTYWHSIGRHMSDMTPVLTMLMHDMQMITGRMLNTSEQFRVLQSAYAVMLMLHRQQVALHVTRPRMGHVPDIWKSFLSLLPEGNASWMYTWDLDNAGKLGSIQVMESVIKEMFELQPSQWSDATRQAALEMDRIQRLAFQLKDRLIHGSQQRRQALESLFVLQNQMKLHTLLTQDERSQQKWFHSDVFNQSVQACASNMLTLTCLFDLTSRSSVIRPISEPEDAEYFHNIMLRAASNIGAEALGNTIITPVGSVNPFSVLKGKKKFEWRNNVWGLTSDQSPDLFFKVSSYPPFEHYLNMPLSLDEEQAADFFRVQAFYAMTPREYAQWLTQIYDPVKATYQKVVNKLFSLHEDKVFQALLMHVAAQSFVNALGFLASQNTVYQPFVKQVAAISSEASSASEVLAKAKEIPNIPPEVLEGVSSVILLAR